MKKKVGYYGDFGGQFVPETLIAPLRELEKVWEKASRDRGFWREWEKLAHDFAGRPTPLFEAKNLAKRHDIHRLYLKREDLCHTGSHKINNALGQALLAKRLGKDRVIAETGAGQHGVATATAAALMGLDCEVFMGEEDMKRQRPNVERMQLLGAKVHPVTSGSRTLKDAMNEALRFWVAEVRSTHYIIGSVAGPHPYPLLVREFQAVIGKELKKDLLRRKGKGPTAILACVGGGSNAMGIFHAFLANSSKIRLIAAEAKGAASMSNGRVGIFHGSRSLYLQNDEGQIAATESISAGLDYPGTGPEIAALAREKRIEVFTVDDDEALAAFHELARSEGILPALESCHALALLPRLEKKFRQRATIVVNLSGRGDKDLQTVASRSSGNQVV